MRGKNAKLIRKYSEICGIRDLRPNSTNNRVDYVLKKEFKNLNRLERIKMIQEMKDKVNAFKELNNG